MLSMVGGALKKINGVKDLNKLSSQCHTNKTDSVLQYQPTPIHVLKAKSAGSGLQYDPVSNFSASSSRVTLPSCTKRSHSVDATMPAKRSKMVVDDDDAAEAKFSDSDEGQTVDQTDGRLTVRAANSNVSPKSGQDCSLQSSATNQPVAKVPNSPTNNSQLKTSSKSVPVSAATMKLSTTQSKPKDSSKCSSTSVSQTNLAVSSNCLEPVKLQSAVLNKDDGSGRQQASNSKSVAVLVEKQHTNKDRRNSSTSSSNCLQKNPNSPTNNSRLKTSSTSVSVSAATMKLSTAQSKPKVSSNCSSTSVSQTNLAVSSNCLETVKLQSAILSKDDGSGKQHSSNSKAVAVGVEKQHNNKDRRNSSTSRSKCHQKNTDHKNGDSSRTSESKHHISRADSNNSCQSSDVSSGKQSNKDGHRYHSDVSRKQPSSNSKAAAFGVTEQHTNKDCSSASRNSHQNSTVHRSSDSGKTSKSEHQHSRANDNQSCQSSDITGGKRSSKDSHRHDNALTKSDRVNSSDNNCSVREHRHSSDAHRKNHAHDNSEHGNKTVAAPTSHEDRKNKKLQSETSAHSQKSKTSSSESTAGKCSSSHTPNKGHKTSHHTNSEHKQNVSMASGVHSSQEGGCHTESRQSGSVTNVPGKESKISNHRHGKCKESTKMTDSRRTQLVGSADAESCSSRTAVGVSRPPAVTKQVSALRNIELFGEDSDTESSLLQSSVSARMPAKSVKSSVSSRGSQSSDEVILLPTDDLSGASDNDDTFEQCQQLYNDLARRQQSKPNCTSTSIHSVRNLS